MRQLTQWYTLNSHSNGPLLWAWSGGPSCEPRAMVLAPEPGAVIHSSVSSFLWAQVVLPFLEPRAVLPSCELKQWSPSSTVSMVPSHSNHAVLSKSPKLWMPCRRGNIRKLPINHGACTVLVAQGDTFWLIRHLWLLSIDHPVGGLPPSCKSFFKKENLGPRVWDPNPTPSQIQSPLVFLVLFLQRQHSNLRSSWEFFVFKHRQPFWQLTAS